MTQEEKAKLYDEVVNKLKDFMAQGVDPLITRADVQDFFPELKESEDERIKREIIELVRFYHGSSLARKHTVSKDEMVAWLEKQGQTFTKKDVDDAYLKGVCDAKTELEKQGEQKPTDEEMKTILQTEYEKGRADAIAEFHKEWSEEDNQMIENIIDYLKPMPIFYETTTGRSGKEYTRKFITEAIEFLKSLQPRSKNKCSAKDKEMILGLLSFISLHGSLVEGGIDEWYDWLKELEERLRGVQRQWKPSDEQMHYLYWIANIKLGDSVVEQEVSKHLNELYQDLKKLKG